MNTKDKSKQYKADITLDHTSKTSTINWYKDAILLISISAVFGLDQLTKYLTRETLQIYESWPNEGIFRLTHETNSGAAFGLFQNQTPILIVASIIAVAFIYYFYKTYAIHSRLLRLCIGLQLGGAFGNLSDRIIFGYVTDFIDVGWWPVFNLADSSIVVGISILIIIILVNGKLNIFETSKNKPTLNGK